MMSIYNWQNPYVGFGSRLGPTVKKLIIINVVVFLVIHLFSRLPWFLFLGLVPRFVVSKLMLWQLFTYMFLHAGLWHLVINMLMLWFFGSDLERFWGSRRFLVYYLFTGVGAGLCSFLTAFHSLVPVVGASGAIFGILLAYALLFPDTIVFLFFFFPMRIRQAVFVLAGINLLGALSNPGAGMAYFAHLGGALFGYLYLKNEKLWQRFFNYTNLFNFRARWKENKAKKRQLQDLELKRETDRILEKISKQGMESLSRKERQTLEKRSRLY
jgi:membrane associated rhomboid family serine protease